MRNLEDLYCKKCPSLMFWVNTNYLLSIEYDITEHIDLENINVLSKMIKDIKIPPDIFYPESVYEYIDFWLHEKYTSFITIIQKYFQKQRSIYSYTLSG